MAVNELIKIHRLLADSSGNPRNPGALPLISQKPGKKGRIAESLVFRAKHKNHSGRLVLSQEVDMRGHQTQDGIRWKLSGMQTDAKGITEIFGDYAIHPALYLQDENRIIFRFHGSRMQMTFSVSSDKRHSGIVFLRYKR